MSNIFTYLTWRGDLSLAQSGFNEVDNLILSTLCYLDFERIVPAPGQGSVTVEQAAKGYFQRHPAPNGPDRQFDPTVRREWMLVLLSRSARFKRLRLSRLVNILDQSQDKQFSALCVHLNPRQIYVAYQGTSDDLTGWKEDFLLACQPEIPSQEEALSYLIQTAEAFPAAQLMLGGHSKGGNLAVFAAAQAEEAIQQRIPIIWSNDSPGFQEDFLRQPGHRRVQEKIQSIVPKSSVIGMLLNHEENYRVVDSEQVGWLQHDGLSWAVMADHFVALPALTPQSLQADTAIRSWLKTIPMEERAAFVHTLFDVLSASGAHTVTEIRKEKLKVMTGSILAMKNLPREMRDRIVQFMVVFSRVTGKINRESARHRAARMLEDAWTAHKKPLPGVN